MKRPFLRFAIRWLVCALGLWIAAAILGGRLTYGDSTSSVIIAGFLLALLNAVIKPIIIIFSLPAILLTLGLFMIVINGLMVILVSWLYDPLQITNFWVAIVAGMVIGFVNYLVTVILDDM